MGYLDAFPTATPPSLSDLGAGAGVVGQRVPLRTERLHCWAARDGFFACLDRNGIVDSISDAAGRQAAERACGREDQVLRRDCASSWVKYFKERRVYEQRKKDQLNQLAKEGAQKLEGTLPPTMGAAAPAGGTPIVKA